MAGRVGSPRGAGSAKRGSWTGVLGIQDADPERCQVEDGGGLESDGGWGGIPDGLGTIEDSECRRPRVGKPHLFIRHLPNGGQVGTLFPLVENESQPQEFIKCAGNCTSP